MDYYLGNDGHKVRQKIAACLQSYSTRLSLENLNIERLPQLPENLTFLACHNTKIATLDRLPPNLEELIIEGAWHLNHLSSFPSSLRKFSCNTSTISSIINLPRSLENFKLSKTNVNYIKIPQNVTYLDCADNTALLDIGPLPYNLIDLNISRTHILNLPQLPKSLKTLICAETFITSLPNLPERLLWLNIIGTNIKKMPNIPYNLSKLTCSHLFAISNFTTMPDAMVRLDCVCAYEEKDKCFSCFYTKHKYLAYSEAWLIWLEMHSKERIMARTEKLKRPLIEKLHKTGKFFNFDCILD